jgi:glucose-6-phosphate 1-dehydrogenase
VALRTEIQNWRWAGVPFYLRTGKRLAGRDAQIVVNFRPVPHAIFPGPGAPTGWSSTCSPSDGLELHLLAQGQRAAPAHGQPRWRRCSWTWTLTRRFGPSAWAPTNGCCWT